MTKPYKGEGRRRWGEKAGGEGRRENKGAKKGWTKGSRALGGNKRNETR